MVTAEYKKEWYNKNRERKLAREKERYNLNREKILIRQRKRLQEIKSNPEKYKEFREKHNKRSRERYVLNREKESARKRKKYYELKQENPPYYTDLKKKACERAKSNYQKKKKHNYFEYQIIKKYGLTEKMYNDMLFKQEYKCSLCLKTFNILNRKEINVDHDHITGKVRDLLCCRCNLVLGLAKDDKEYLKLCINYLEKHK